MLNTLASGPLARSQIFYAYAIGPRAAYNTVMAVLLAIVATFSVLLLNEWWWRAHKTHSEFSRKFAHIIIGSGAACGPFFVSWGQIQWLGVAACVGVVASKYFGVLRMIHSVQRTTYGELSFAAAVAITPLITHNKWVYAAAILEMGLADGLAAVLGVHYGRRRQYSVFGRQKSLAGTLTFAVVSVVILLGYTTASGSNHLATLPLLGIVLLATLVENLAFLGLDNLLVPVVVAAILQRLV